jgi:dolichol-phosphate mannosyltransferase
LLTTDVTTANSRTALTLVLPTYNERDRLGSLLERVCLACDVRKLSVDIVVVDDDSPDGTGALADEWAKRGRVRVIHRSRKLGLGSAVLEGFGIAESNVVGVMDADLSHPPDLVPVLYDAMAAHDLDMVVASRYVGSGSTRHWSIKRIVLSRLGCWLSRPLTPVRDAMSGFFLLRRDRVQGFRTSTSGFKIGLELLSRADLRRVGEVEYAFVDREAGRSKMNLSECLRFLKQLVRLYVRSLSSSTTLPTHVFVRRNLTRPVGPVDTVVIGHISQVAGQR